MKIAALFSGQVDPQEGVLCLSMHWRPNPDDPDPEMPGQKLSMSLYIPRAPPTCVFAAAASAFRMAVSQNGCGNPFVRIRS